MAVLSGPLPSTHVPHPVPEVPKAWSGSVLLRQTFVSRSSARDASLSFAVALSWNDLYVAGMSPVFLTYTNVGVVSKVEPTGPTAGSVIEVQCIGFV